MPCTDNWSQADQDRCEADNNKKKYGMAVSDQALLGELACTACGILEGLGYDFTNGPTLLAKWWPEHKKQDEKRKEKERKDAVRRKIEKEHSWALKKALKDAGVE